MNSGTDDWFHWNSDLNNSNYNENNREADNKDNMNIYDDSDIIDLAEQLSVNATSNITGFIKPLWKSKHTATLVIMNSTPVNTQYI